jgi:Mrp family chromosome partitioning ATPase
MKNTKAKAGFYLDLIRTVFQAIDDQGKLSHRVVAITSATPGEGVSHVVDILAEELATQTQNRVLRVDATSLKSIQATDPNKIWLQCEETEIENLLTLSAAETAPAMRVIGAERTVGGWESAPEYRAECLKALRWNFDYVLIDCPATSVSSEAAMLAPLVDGVCVVVKAAQTRRGQVQHCQQEIENAGGSFLGFILNRRKYPVPNWLYRRL